MFKIGDFSRLSQISIRMLRFYDEQDILKPIFIDEENGYRHYDATQLVITNQINFLRQTGFSTQQIKKIVHSGYSKEQLQMLVTNKQDELRKEIFLLEKKIASLEKTKRLLEKEKTMMSYEVEIKKIPSQIMMCKRGIIPSYEKEWLLWNGLKNEIGELKKDIEYCDDIPARTYFYDDGYIEKDPDVEVCVAVKKKYQDTENIKFKTMPSKKCACITFKGSFDLMAEVHFVITNWIVEHHFELDGPNFTIFHKGPGMCESPDEYITEVCFPIK